MTAQRFFNWPAWLALLLAVAALITYPTVFVRFPSTRDVPWATLLTFGVAILLVIVGLRRAREIKTRSSRIGAGVIAGICFALLTLFVFAFFVGGRQLPRATGAPQVGKKAPEFTLTDTQGKPVSLSQLLSEPVAGHATRGVLLVFYRGYW